MVRIGKLRLRGEGKPLPRNREKAKQVLKSIAKEYGVEGVHFLRIKCGPKGASTRGGWYKPWAKRIGVVEREGSRQRPLDLMAFCFFHELTHHLQNQEFLFEALFYGAVSDENGKWREIPLSDARRVVVRAERHADQKAAELAWEFFGLNFWVPKYTREDVQRTQKRLFEAP
jgi:hypothetical protein